MSTPWKNAFHPSDPIRSRDLNEVVLTLECAGCRVRTDVCGRIVSVVRAGRELLTNFFPATDDPAQFLGRDLVRSLEAAVRSGGSADNERAWF